VCKSEHLIAAKWLICFTGQQCIDIFTRSTIINRKQVLSVLSDNYKVALVKMKNRHVIFMNIKFLFSNTIQVLSNQCLEITGGKLILKKI